MGKAAPPSGPDFYETLGVSPSASAAEIRQAFVSLIRKHRDQPGETDVAAIDRARQINRAYNHLRNPAQRRAYDESRGIFFGGAASKAAPVEAFEQPGEGPQHDLPSSGGQPSPQEAAPAVEQPSAPVEPYRFQAFDEQPKRRTKSWLAAAALVPVVALAAVFSGLLGSPDENRDALTPAGGGGVEPQAAAPPPATEAAAAESALRPPAGVPDALPGDRAVAPEEVQLAQAPSAADSRAPPAAVPKPPQALAVRPGEAATAPAPERIAVAEPPAASGPAAAPSPAAAAERPGTPAKWISGGLLDRDNPYGRLEGTVNLRFTVTPAGRASDCRPVNGSGNASLGALTCRLVQERLRFSPALDGSGRPVASELRTSYTWGRKRRR